VLEVSALLTRDRCHPYIQGSHRIPVRGVGSSRAGM